MLDGSVAKLGPGADDFDNITPSSVGVDENTVTYHYGRRLFTTNCGRLGLGLKDVKLSDLVCVIPRCNFPPCNASAAEATLTIGIVEEEEEVPLHFDWRGLYSG